MQPNDFIKMVVSDAQKLQAESHLFTSVTLAQCALETGWGSFIPIDKDSHKVSYNLFGVKGEGTNGSVSCSTREEDQYGHSFYIVAQFRAYNNFYESLKDHLSLLLTDEYKAVRDAQTPEEACQALYDCGYATDHLYPQKLVSIINDFNLKEYDSIKPEVPEVVLQTSNGLEGYTDMKVEDANKIIQILGGLYNAEVTPQEEKDELHRLANEIRIASGQPTT